MSKNIIYVGVIFTTLINMFFVNDSYSQPGNDQYLSRTGGDVKISKDSRIDTLILRTVNANDFEPKINGYRIQIFFGSNRNQANKLKSDFIQAYPKEKIYLVYKQPYFKLLVGDYRNRIEAQKMFHELTKDEDFKGVLIVPHEINLPALR